MNPRNIVLIGGPYNGTKLDQISFDELPVHEGDLTMGIYKTNRNAVNEREVFEWEPNK